MHDQGLLCRIIFLTGSIEEILLQIYMILLIMSLYL